MAKIIITNYKYNYNYLFDPVISIINSNETYKINVQMLHVILIIYNAVMKCSCVQNDKIFKLRIKQLRENRNVYKQLRVIMLINNTPLLNRALKRYINKLKIIVRDIDK